MADKNPFASVGLGMFGAEGQQGGLGQDLLAGLTAYGIDKSGLKDYLNSKGISKNAQGQWGYAEPKITQDMYGVSPNAMGPAMPPPPQAAAPVPPTVQQTAPAPVAPAAPTAPALTTPPAGIGNKILDNDWHGASDYDQERQDKFASQSASGFVPTMGYKPEYAMDRLKQFATLGMMG